MARVYNSRALLDPTMIQMVGNRADQNVAFENALKERNAGNLRNVLLGAGKLADQKIGEYQRAKEVGNWNFNDPIARAAREEYIRTGSSQPMMSYEMQQMAAAQRDADAVKRAEEAKRSKALHDAVTLRSDRDKHNEYQTLMYKAMDEGRLADAQAYKEKMTGLENFYKENYPEFDNPFGKSAESMWQAREEEKNLKAAQEAEIAKEKAKEEAKEAQRADQAMEEILSLKKQINDAPDFDTKMKLLKDIDDKNKYVFMNDKERDDLKKEVLAQKTEGEKTSDSDIQTKLGIRSEKIKKASDKKEEDKLQSEIKTALGGFSTSNYADARRKAEEMAAKYPNKKFRATGSNGNFKVVQE